MSDLYIGLMSGTSLDGVDAVLARFAEGQPIEVLAHCHQPFDATLRSELLALNQPDGADEAHRCALAANGVARAYAAVIAELLRGSGHEPAQIRASGAHGQTIRHRPGEFDGCGYTLQLLNGALLAELSGVAVVNDLRSRDVAAGGQGAPLVPAFHQALFGRDDTDIAVLNIGGISNISVLNRNGNTAGYDCGPGNCLMDFWIERHRGTAFDAGGTWAASGQVLPDLLQALLAEPFFRQPPPRSTGRDLFNPGWLQAHLDRQATATRAEDVQATLLELSAASIADCVPTRCTELLVCGGGALNTRLMERLQARLPQLRVLSTAARGLPPMQVEAAAFAWLAMRFELGLPGNLPAVTGAAGPRVLGAYHPA